MSAIKGINKLGKAFENLKVVVEEMRLNLDAKKEWWDEKSENWQVGEKGQLWDEYFCTVEDFLDEIDNLEMFETPDNL